jgi:hypothetical protein
MSSPTPLETDDALDELVNQFADPMSFLRELVQNALDAGSTEVEISVDWQGGTEGPGVVTTTVEDWGVGMTRTIIETRLTRLFSSDKDGDKTKIGKFGIGFVSVFAIEPDAVCIDTARDGERWRVLFDASRRFQLLRLDEPIEGTRIRILKSMDRADYEQFAHRAREVLEYWCRHTTGEIRFEGVVVSRPLDLEAPCQIDHDDGFSRILVGHPVDGRTFFGFYNTGLTLLEGNEGQLEGLAFKVSSPHLEHTLTRDSIIEDAGFERVMQSLNRIVDGPLEERVFAMLAEALGAGQSERLPYLYRAALWHARRGTAPSRKAGDRVAFRTPSGTAVTLDRVWGRHRDQRIQLASVRSPLTDALEKAGFTVIDDSAGACVARLLAEHARTLLVRAAEHHVMPLPAADEGELRRWTPLSRAVTELLDGWGAKLSGVELGHFDYPGSSIRGVLAITQRAFGEITPRDEIGTLGTGVFSRRRVLAVNADHPLVAPLVVMAGREPELAAYMLVKSFFIGERLDPEVDGRLLDLASERRWHAKSTG